MSQSKRVVSLFAAIAIFLSPVAPRTLASVPVAAAAAPVQVPDVIRQALLNNGISPMAVEQVWLNLMESLTFAQGWVQSLSPSLQGPLRNAIHSAGSMLSVAISSLAPATRDAFLRVLAARIGQLANAVTKAVPFEAQLRNPNNFKRMGAASAEFLVGMALAVVIGKITYTAASIKGERVVARQHLEARANDDAAFMHTVGLLFEGLASGRITLLPGLTESQAIQKIQENFEVGRPPFVNVLHLRACPNIAGAWYGELVVRDVRGSTNVRVGESTKVFGSAFTISQPSGAQAAGACDVTLYVLGESVRGSLARSITVPRQIGTQVQREEQDTFILDQQPSSSMTRAELTAYGLGAQSLQGNLTVSIEQRRRDGSVVTLGGILTRTPVQPEPADLASFNGAWTCPQRGTIAFNVSGATVTGNFAGRGGEHWDSNQRKGGTVTGTVKGTTMTLTMHNGDGTRSPATITLAANGRSFSGSWEWFRDQTKLASGTWSCTR